MSHSQKDVFYDDVVIVDAGAAGIGCGVVLKELGLERFTILDQHQVGASFSRWPEEMRFITPSFPSNGFGLLDLNAVTMETSPAIALVITAIASVLDGFDAIALLAEWINPPDRADGSAGDHINCVFNAVGLRRQLASQMRDRKVDLRLLDRQEAAIAYRQRITTTQEPEPGLLFGMNAIFLWKGHAIALLAARIRSKFDTIV